MKWYSVKKYSPIHNGSLMLCARDNGMEFHLCKYGYHQKTDNIGFINEHNFLVDGVTHFSVIEPVEVEE